MISDAHNRRMWCDIPNYISQYVEKAKIPFSDIKFEKNESSINSFRDNWRSFKLITNECLKRYLEVERR